MFIFIMILLFLILLGIFSFIIFKVYNALMEVIKSKYIRLGLILIFSVILIIMLKIDMMDTIVIYLHLLIFWLILDLIKKIIKLKIKKITVFIITLVITGTYLTWSYFSAVNVVKTNYTLYTNKNIDNFRIVQISDSHIGNTMNGDKFIEYMEKINKDNPDIVVVTGDFIDDDTSYDDMVKGCIGLGKLNTKYGVYFIYGNHDEGYFNKRNYKTWNGNGKL